jgi:hypothetical protein
MSETLVLNDAEWFLIEDAPKDDRRFIVGMWDGEKLWNTDFSKFAWAEKPIWRQAISHDDNHREKYNGSRGWNHRNGALNGQATHWTYELAPPPLTDPVATLT